MNRVIYIFLFSLFAFMVKAQTALYNQGNLRIHENGQLGFHTDLINDGTFDENLGLAGFYATGPAISGALPPTFFDVEFAAMGSTLLNTSVNVANNANFISGNVVTFRNTSDVSLLFLENAFFTGENDDTKTDGYASVSGQANFTFPVGDANQLRPLIMQSSGAGGLAKCAYFFEDPSNPQSLDDAFDTGRTAPNVGVVSPFEFWRLESDVPTTISISWNERSNLSGLTDDVNTIAIVGFSKSLNQWVGLGNTSRAGDLSQGFVSSAQFVPNDYEAITFSGSGAPDVLLALDNYLVSANGDGINDFLEIPELEQSPNNELFIYDRFGMKVFEQTNYTNEFNGFANTGDFVFQREKGLPSGVYYYVVSLKDVGLDFQGFFYLTR